MLEEFIKAFFLVFIAEMGDKTQILAMTFAAKYSLKKVLLGVSIGVVLNHGIAIILGNYLKDIISISTIQILAGILFIFFGFLSLKIEESDDEIIESSKGPIITVASAFFIGELGDKTQLTAMTIATESLYPLVILMGTTLAMLATSSLGVLIGSKLGNSVKEEYINLGSSFLFVVIGSIKIIKSYIIENFSYNILYILLFIFIVLLTQYILTKRYFKHIKSIGGRTAYKHAAEKLYRQTKKTKNNIEKICLGESICEKCIKEECFVGYIKKLLEISRENDKYYIDKNICFEIKTNELIKKQYNEDIVIKALKDILIDYEEYNWPKDSNFVINQIKQGFEIYLFGFPLKNIYGYDEYLDEIKKIDYIIYEKIKKLDI